MVGTTELAAVLGITGRRIRQLAEDGVFTKQNGAFNLTECVQRYIAGLNRDAPSQDDARLDKAKQQAEVTLKASKAQIAKMEADELRGKMHRSEDVEAMTEDLIYTIRAGLVSLPGRLAVDTAACPNPAECAEIIRKEVFAVMDELANYKYDPLKYEERVRQRRDWDTAHGRDADDE